jgi:hypothetical protein
MNNLYEQVSNMDKKTRFIYIIITVFIVCIFSRLDIGLNIVFACGISYLIIKYLNDKKTVKIDDINNQNKIKATYIKPEPKLINNYPDLIDFFFTIQELYNYNPQAYEEIIDNIESMLILYKDIDKITSKCEDRYQIAESKIRNALNALHSLIFSLENNKMINKLNKAHRKLNHILNNYLFKMFKKCEDTKLISGYNSDSRLIEFDKPKPHNTYNNNNKFSYEFY